MLLLLRALLRCFLPGGPSGLPAGVLLSPFFVGLAIGAILGGIEPNTHREPGDDAAGRRSLDPLVLVESPREAADARSPPNRERRGVLQPGDEISVKALIRLRNSIDVGTKVRTRLQVSSSADETLTDQARGVITIVL